MGRTNPTFRDWLRAVEEDWQPFRRALRRAHQDDFDRLFERAAAFADAAGHANSRDPELAMLLSVLLAHEVELRALREGEEPDVPLGPEGPDDGTDPLETAGPADEPE